MTILDLIEIGYVVRAHGVRGELRVACHNPASTALAAVDEVDVGGHRFAVAAARPVKDAYLLALSGLTDRTRAEALRGQPVSVERAALEMDEDEFLLADLIGCAAVLESGESYGTVIAVEPGPQDRLVIADGEVERLLPLVAELVPEVDFERSRIVVAPPPGLPDSPRRDRRDGGGRQRRGRR